MGVVLDPPPPPPPQAAIPTISGAQIRCAKHLKLLACFLFLDFRNSPGSKSPKLINVSVLPNKGAVFVAAIVLIVKVVAAAVVFGVTLAGLKLHTDPDGKPEHEKVTAVEKPAPAGDTVTSKTALTPALTVAAGPVPPCTCAPTEKSWVLPNKETATLLAPAAETVKIAKRLFPATPGAVNVTE